ncbi:hypothetical protein ZWY2020_026812 [Hordeum vulgare]|nr:hypothetical protein ZWY2020_026812 [Hordeum vulgare]
MSRRPFPIWTKPEAAFPIGPYTHSADASNRKPAQYIAQLLSAILLPAQRLSSLNPTASGAARGRADRNLAGVPAPPLDAGRRNPAPFSAQSPAPRPEDRSEPVNRLARSSPGLRLSRRLHFHGQASSCFTRVPEQGQDSAWTPFILCTSSFWLPTFSR